MNDRCHHAQGFTTDRCRCGLFFQYCPVCEPYMVLCVSCQEDPSRRPPEPEPDPHCHIFRTPGPTYSRRYYLRHREHICSKRLERYHRLRKEHHNA